MIKSVLIANRGEIARRVMRTAKRLGIRTIAVYSEPDERALHVSEADQAIAIGAAAAAESYLNAEKILAAARDADAEAIHPGYGFLSENADFAAAVEAAGLIFIGPTPDVIRTMGEKNAAKACMEKIGVPIIPGDLGQDQDGAALAAAAKKTGYPVLIKAVAGGGGRGMRSVAGPSDFAQALQAAKREAASAFGDDRMIIEKQIVRAKHIEVQVFADGIGNAVHLFERDCSIQRRHQKVIEEAPASGISKNLRSLMCADGVRIAEAIGYRGAGTIEFMVSGDAYYFLEMNCRLQVEHPVTEMITGLDLVEWQFRIAAGEGLPLAQDGVCASGHAIEARLYAEDPAHGFLPASGRIETLSWPDARNGLRIDTGVRAGDAVSINYDPMIAKLAVSAETRDQAIEALGAALAGTEITGLKTNRAFLERIARSDEFKRGEMDTTFIEAHLPALLAAALSVPAGAVIRAAVHLLGERKRQSGNDPWQRTDAWRLNQACEDRLYFAEPDDGPRIDVGVTFTPDGYALELWGNAYAAPEPGSVSRSNDGALITVHMDGADHTLVYLHPDLMDDTADEIESDITAPMPGIIIDVPIKAGQTVAGGDIILVMEAMKMEINITAPADGVVEAVYYAPGDEVSEGETLLHFEAN